MNIPRTTVRRSLALLAAGVLLAVASCATGDPLDYAATLSKHVEISPIFKWFGEDFVPAYGATADFHDRSDKERAVLNFIAQHAGEGDARFLRSEKEFTIVYKDYDWSLNEQ